MRKGSPKWAKIIYKEVEPEDVPKLVRKLLDNWETAVEVAPYINDTYSVSCKVLTEDILRSSRGKNCAVVTITE